MTDITELAQREKFEAWAMTKICISKSTLEGLRTAEGYRNTTLSGTDYNRMWAAWKAAGAELVEALEKAQAQSSKWLEAYHKAVSIGARYEERIAELEEAEQKLCAANVTLDARAEQSERRLAELESRTVTPVMYSENADADYCRKWAWEQVKDEVSTEDWTTGDSITYFGFFCWGWDMRRQYNEQRPVTVKLPDIMPPEAAPAHYWGSGESMAYADGYNKSAADLKTSFAQACSFAGVNVEFE